ncbi:hypothetical protein D3C80_2211990 [compost metagenome]
MRELMPITSPRRLNSGPPELPGLIGTSVCKNCIDSAPGNSRPLALTMPAVTELPKP